MMKKTIQTTIRVSHYTQGSKKLIKMSRTSKAHFVPRGVCYSTLQRSPEKKYYHEATVWSSIAD
jgi:hypothetical protein